jgi:hypothetical protein
MLSGTPGANRAEAQPRGPVCVAPRLPSGLEGDLFAAINQARVDPAGYAANLPRSSGVDSREAAAFLQEQRPLAPLRFHPKLMRAAEGHAAEIGAAGSVSHVGRDGSGLLSRIQRAGHYPMAVAENISVGQDTGVEAANMLIIDPGLPNRPHRKDLFDPTMVFAGVACRPHKTYGVICVIDMSGPPIARDNAPPEPC